MTPVSAPSSFLRLPGPVRSSPAQETTGQGERGASRGRDTDRLLQLIQDGNRAEFKATLPTFITTDDWLTLADAVVARQDDLPQQEWLEALLDKTPSPGAETTPRRHLAKLLMERIGRQGIKADSSEKCSILKHIVENTANICSEEDLMKRTLFHVAAMNGLDETIELLSTAVCPDGHSSGGGELARLLTALDTDGRPPIDYAITTGRARTVRALLNLLDKTEPNEVQRFLRHAIASERGHRVDIMHELLLVCRAGPDGEHTYRANIVEENILRCAIDKYRPEVFEFLVDRGSAVLAVPDCNLIHYAVYQGQTEAAKYLLAKFPDLATKFHYHPDYECPGTVMGNKVPPKLREGTGPHAGGQEQKLPLLALYGVEDSCPELRDLILRTLMAKLSIGELREHLKGPTWTGKEISLDATILASDAKLLAAFIESVERDLHDADTAEKLQGRRDRDADGTCRHQDPPNAGGREVGPDDRPFVGSQVQFERVMSYVRIPLFDDQARKHGKGPVSILRWLKTCKGVKQVLKITVDDRRHCPSPEEDIEMALQGLGVRHLDWKRPDLSIRSVTGIARELKVLRLYSSGSLAVIDHWTGPRGIGSLSLDELHIQIMQGFVSHERAKYCQSICENAELRVEKARRVVDIETEPIPKSTGRSRQGAAVHATKQDALAVTELRHFVEAYTSFRREAPSLAPDSDTRTKVALLDSGVNSSWFTAWSDNNHGRSFVGLGDGRRREFEPCWWLAIDRHGSYMANIISQLDPTCILYVLQIAESMVDIALPAVVEALEWAVEHNMCIINCSFVLNRCSDELRAVLRKANEKQILVMCSTADQGQDGQQVWPAGYYRPDLNRAEQFRNIFPIIGCNNLGKASDYADKDGGRFMFQGEGIDASDSRNESGGPRDADGSSAATAIATGVASLILGCYKAVAPELRHSPRHEDLVSACFAEMSIDRRRGSRRKGKILQAKPSRLFPTKEESILDAKQFWCDVRDALDDLS